MHIIWFYTLVSVLIVSLVSLVGILAISINIKILRRFLTPLVSFSAGSMLGGAFIHLLPEIAENQGFNTAVSTKVLTGILIFFVLEKIVCWRHCHVPTSKDHPHTLGIMNLIGDAFHNFTDGIIIAAAFLSSPSLGIAATLAVIFHEIPQEIGDYSVLIYAGFSKIKALLFNLLSAAAAILGAVFTLWLGEGRQDVINMLLPLTAGGFIYIAAADLLPELKKEEGLKKSLLQFISLLLGIFIMWLIRE